MSSLKSTLETLQQGSATPGTRATIGTRHRNQWHTRNKWNIVQNIKILFLDPERDRRQGASPRYLQKEAMHAAPLSLTPGDFLWKAQWRSAHLSSK